MRQLPRELNIDWIIVNAWFFVVIAPVFIHSSFRTSSTWLWEKFRHTDQVVAFYEPFNEILGQISLEEARNYGNNSWSSGHPPVKSYFTEYFPLFKDGKKGIEKYEIAFAFEEFFPESDHLEASQADYIENLIRISKTKRPLLACTRSLARIAPLRRSFGGQHIFLFRNIYDQWSSYIRHYREGNGYFFQTLAWTFSGARKSPDVSHFMAKYTPRFEGGEFCGFLREQDALSSFLALHLYLYAKAFSQADLVLDATRLCLDTSYRSAMEKEFLEIFGFGVSLSDATRRTYDLNCDIDFHTVEAVVQDIQQNVALTAAETDFVNSLAASLLSSAPH